MNKSEITQILGERVQAKENDNGTALSISMISDAVRARKPVLVMQLGNGKLSEKHKRFQRMLASRAAIQVANAGNFRHKLDVVAGKEAKGHEPKDVTVRESKRIREAIRKLMRVG